MFTVKLSKYHRLLRAAKQRLSTTSTFSTKQDVFSMNDNEALEVEEKIKESIIFNSILESRKIKLGWGRNKGREEKMKRLEKIMTDEEIKNKPITSVAFKYLNEEYKQKLLNDIRSQPKPEPLTSIEKDPEEKISNEPVKTSPTSNSTVNEIQSWSRELEDFDMSDDENLDLMQIGTADPNIRPSQTPCGGCGAVLHCQDHNKPGFMPKELFHNIPDKHLRAMICQRCHFFKNYSTALDVNVATEDYPKILGEIRKKRALVLLVVDLMDFPCSIWPQLSEVIGANRPVCIVGNKVDLLPPDSSGYLDRITKVLRSEVQKATGLADSNIKHVALVSAKTGYGIEQLINKIHTNWQYKGDVYLVGCTNVGKSSLFNALVKSDLCKVKAVDLVQRATTSPWPGTTLNLLKFPMLRPEGWRLFIRTKRMIKERAAVDAEEKLKKEKLKKTKNLEYATLTGHVGRTFRNEIDEKGDMFSLRIAPAHDFNPEIGLDPRDRDLKESRWCFDTPGTMQPDQVLNLLTEEELELTLPSKIISPQSFNIRPEQSLFIAGLGRLDFLGGHKNIMMTVFTSENLPLTVCWTKDAASLYSSLIGSELLSVPSGDQERLSDWPGLKAGPVITLQGQGWKESCADILLSSAGWVAVTLGLHLSCTLQAHTPDARGIYVRQPALLPFAVDRRGAKVRNSPAYRRFRPILQ